MGCDILQQIASPFCPDVYSLDDEIIETIAEVITGHCPYLHNILDVISTGVFDEYCPEWLEDLYNNQNYPYFKYIPFNHENNSYILDEQDKEEIRDTIFSYVFEDRMVDNDLFILIYAYEKLTQE